MQALFAKYILQNLQQVIFSKVKITPSRMSTNLLDTMNACPVDNV